MEVLGERVWHRTALNGPLSLHADDAVIPSGNISRRAVLIYDYHTRKAIIVMVGFLSSLNGLAGIIVGARHVFAVLR